MAAFSGKLGQLLVQEALPEAYRRNRVLDKKGLTELLQEIAQNSPEQYRAISHKLSKLGFQAAQATGGYSFGISDLRRTSAAEKFKEELGSKIQELIDNDDVTDDDRESQIISLLEEAVPRQQSAVFQEALKANNPLALQAASGARGNQMNLTSLLGSDLLYEDHRGRKIPVPVFRSYSQGLTPAEYWAAAYGARKGVVDVKTGTAKAGFLAKQLVQAAHRLVVTRDDDDRESPTLRGLPVDTDDNESVGALLSAPAGGFKRNTVVTAKLLNSLRDQGIKRILLRSPTVGGPREGGIFARDAGIREQGRLPDVGSIPGIVAAQALSEPLAQSQLCLAKGTLVRMADWTTKAIEKIEAGDWVLGADQTGRTFPSQVTDTYDNGARDCLCTSFGVSKNRERVELISTGDHKLLVARRHRVLSKIRRALGVIPVNCCGNNHAAVVVLPVRERETAQPERLDTQGLYMKSQVPAGRMRTFDITVANADHLFVLANGLIVSNSSKHSGGVSGAARGVSGFDLINQYVQIPKTFQGGATHSQLDGVVNKIEPAPAGGYYVTIDGHRHYVPDGLDLKVQQGDHIEAGDTLSEGMPNPGEIVKHKGVGEGRRYFTFAFRDAMRGAGIKADRRNVEMLSRGLINHVKLTDELGEYAPDDIISYQDLEHSYQPREGFQKLTPKKAVGKYLERPYLHYTIGTKVRPSMMKDFEDFQVPDLDVHDDPPPFEPEMIRGMYTLQHDPDWQTRMLGSGMKDSVLDAVHRGGSSDEAGTSYVPAAARGINFGKIGPIKPPKLPTPKPMFKAAVSAQANPTGAAGLTSGTETRPTPKPEGFMGSPPAVGAATPPTQPKPTGGGFGEFFQNFGNLTRGRGNATAGFKNTLSGSQFAKSLAPPPAAAAPLAPAMPTPAPASLIPPNWVPTVSEYATRGLTYTNPVTALLHDTTGFSPFAAAGAALSNPAQAAFDTNAQLPSFLQFQENTPEAQEAAANFPTNFARWWKGAADQAKGIPSRREYGDINKLLAGKLYTFLRQKHDALRAGPHTDVRIGDKDMGLLSWAVRKDVPAPGERRLAVQQPVHRFAYKDFEGEIPMPRYGAGTVKKEEEGRVLLTDVKPGKISFTMADRRHPERFTMVQSRRSRDWLLVNTTPTNPLSLKKLQFTRIPAEQMDTVLKDLEPGSSVQPKVDGASALVQLLKHNVELMSYRTSRQTGRPITHTERVLRGRPSIDVPPEQVGSVLRGETYGIRETPEGRKVIHPAELGGLLNSSLGKSLDDQASRGVELRNMLFDVAQHGKTPIDPNVTPYAQRRQLLQSFMPTLGPKFEIAPEATTPEEAMSLWSQIRAGEHPLTREGVVIQPPTGLPMKSKLTEDYNVHIRNLFPGEGKYLGSGAGGFEYSLEPDSDIVGRVGTGLSDETRRDMHANPSNWIGRVARVKSQEQLPSGALRAPSFLALNEDV